MLNPVYEFLSQYKMEKDDSGKYPQSITHQCYGSFGGCFHLDKIARKELLSIYVKEINKDTKLCVLERQKEYSCILIDVDIKVTNFDDPLSRLYNDKTIKDVIKVYKSVLSKIVENYNDNFIFMVTEKAKPSIKKLNSDLEEKKDGFHIIMPNTCFNKETREYIYDKVIEKANERDIFNGLKADEIIDKAVVSSNGWLLYGSSKPGCLPYILTKIYNMNGKLIYDHKLGKSYDPETGEEYDELYTNEKIIKYCSIQSDFINEKYATPLKENIKINHVPVNNASNNSNIISTLKKNINELGEYFECLSKERYNYNNWIQVAFALHSAIDEYNSDELLDLFNSWSSKDNVPGRYKGLANIMATWRSIKKMTTGGTTLKSFYKWYQEDDNKLFNKLVSKYNGNNDEKTIDEYNKKSYEQQKNLIEKEWFLNNYNCKYYRYYDDELTMKTNTDAQIYFKNIFYPVKIKKGEDIKIINKPFFKDWSEDENQKRYEKVIFNPDPSYKSNSKYYNEWKGWKWLNNEIIIDENKIKPFIDLIKYLCNDDKDVIDFILNWLSWIIQKPHKKTNTAICLYSDKHGVGKNTLIELIKRLFEGYTSKLSRIEDLGKNFNAHYDKKFFIYGDEIKATAKQWANEIKNMITETEKVIERKGIDSQMNKCYVNYFFTTNNEINFQIEDSDRRWLLIECDKERMSSELSKMIYNCIENDDYIIMLFNYLYRRDISNIILLEPPMTEYKQRLINQTLPGYIQYLYNNYKTLANSKIYVDDLFKNMIEYSKQNHLSSLFSKDLVAKYLSKLDNIIFKKCRHREFGIYYDFYNTNTIETFFKKENPLYFKNLYEL